MSLCYLFDFVLHHTATFSYYTGICYCIVVRLVNLLHEVVHGWLGYRQSRVNAFLKLMEWNSR